jgi:hypothetical protein
VSVRQGDVIIRKSISTIIDEIRKTPYLLDDIFADFYEDPLLEEYQGEIKACKDWFLNNKIEILNKLRNDSQSYPCITIAMGSSVEAKDQATLADQSTYTDTLSPEQINKPIPYIIKPFTPLSFVNGKVFTDIDLSLVNPGMLAVNPENGEAWEIEIVELDGFILKNQPLIEVSKLGILPQYRIYKAKRERATFEESYQIGCHVHGDPAQLLWLWSIVLYGMLRYRESLFEARGFKVTSLNSTDIIREESFDQASENIYKRWITISGLMDYSWLKAPKRIIENVQFKDKEGITGIKVLTDTDTPKEVKNPKSDQVWETTQDTKSLKKQTIIFEG